MRYSYLECPTPNSSSIQNPASYRFFIWLVHGNISSKCFYTKDEVKKQRSNICITERFINNQREFKKEQTTLPGNWTYVSATKYDKKKMVLEDSSLKIVKRNHLTTPSRM